VNHAIDLAVGCHYFLPGLRLPQYLSPDGANCKRQHTFDSSLLLIYRPRKDERLSSPSWLTCSGRFTHISGHAPISCRSSAGQGKFAGQRPTFYHCATPPTIRGVGRSNIFGTTSKLVDGFRRGGARNLASREIFDVYGRSTYRCTGRPVWINTPASSAASAKASAAWRNCLEWCPPVVASFYCRAMLCMRGTSHGPVSVCLSVCHKSEFY